MFSNLYLDTSTLKKNDLFNNLQWLVLIKKKFESSALDRPYYII